MHRIYRAASRLLALVPAFGGGKLASSLRGRRGAPARWSVWAERHRSNDPLAWFHAASVGEAHVVQPVVRHLRRSLSEVQCVLTYSSPSAAAWRFDDVDRADFVPFDAPAPVYSVFQALRPSLLIVARSDLWPELLAQARRTRVPTAVVGFRARGARRTGRLPRSLYEPMWKSVSWWGACASADADALRALGVPSERVTITGDPRHDHVGHAAIEASPPRELAEWAGKGPTLVAGSTDRADIELLCDAWRQVLGQLPGLRLLVVPHDPEPHHVRWIARRWHEQGVDFAIWDRGRRPAGAVVIVPMRGILASLYSLASVAYVGGGFARHGAHSVAEPAAAGVPVVVGPGGRSDPDVDRLERVGACVVLPTVEPGTTLVTTVAAMVERASTLGANAQAALVVGAAEKTASQLASLLRDPQRRHQHADYHGRELP